MGIAFGKLEEGYENAIKDYYKKQIAQGCNSIELVSTKSPYVEIKWLKGYCILSTFTVNIPDQSCSSNCGTPYIYIYANPQV